MLAHGARELSREFQDSVILAQKPQPDSDGVTTVGPGMQKSCWSTKSILTTATGKMNAEGKAMAQKSMADLNMLKLNKGYTWSSGGWGE